MSLFVVIALQQNNRYSEGVKKMQRNALYQKNAKFHELCLH